ncbi:MAG: hypothetical protein FWF75_01600 [Propionibacteriaceae bacterium]|nr:hypothetical protein [Propionibacteriaceae bacterium]
MATTSILVLGCLAISAPQAEAGSWSGSVSCPGSTVAQSHGTKGASSSITLGVDSRSMTDNSGVTGIAYTFSGTQPSGQWFVNGGGATQGNGQCGS